MLCPRPNEPRIPNVKSRPRPSIRHCPACGIAMVAKKSRDDALRFDIFECLSCQTVIREVPAPAPDDDPKS